MSVKKMLRALLRFRNSASSRILWEIAVSARQAESFALQNEAEIECLKTQIYDLETRLDELTFRSV